MRGLAAALIGLVIAGTAQAADGEALFDEYCSACHQKGGIGTVGLAPPLVSTIMANARAKMPTYVPLVVLNGLSGRIDVAGQMYISAMPAQPQLSDEDLAAVANYVLGTLNPGDGFAPLDAAAIAALRDPKVGHGELRAMRAELEK